MQGGEQTQQYPCGYARSGELKVGDREKNITQKGRCKR